MARWRLTSEGEQRLLDWGKNASREHRQRAADVLDSIADDTWRGRWRIVGPADITSETEIRAGDGLIVRASKLLDDSQAFWWIHIGWIGVVEDDEADLWDLPDR